MGGLRGRSKAAAILTYYHLFAPLPLIPRQQKGLQLLFLPLDPPSLSPVLVYMCMFSSMMEGPGFCWTPTPSRSKSTRIGVSLLPVLWAPAHPWRSQLARFLPILQSSFLKLPASDIKTTALCRLLTHLTQLSKVKSLEILSLLLYHFYCIKFPLYITVVSTWIYNFIIC